MTTSTRLSKAKTLVYRDLHGLLAEYIRAGSPLWVQVVGRLSDDNDAEWAGGLVEVRGDLYCAACGMLAQPGEETFEWCSHTPDADCIYLNDVSDDDDG